MIAAFVLSLALLAPSTAVPVRTVVVRAPCANLTLEVARTEAQREHGLMNRASLAPHTGMIFVFDSDARVAFWMKNTLISLDMIFVAEDGTVRSVAARVPVVPAGTPDDKIPRREGNAKYVIELPAGEAKRDGIAPGTRMPEATQLETRGSTQWGARSLGRSAF